MSTECPICHYTSGHWPYCPAATVADAANLPEPFRTRRTAVIRARRTAR